MFLLRPLSFGDIVLTVVVALVVAGCSNCCSATRRAGCTDTEDSALVAEEAALDAEEAAADAEIAAARAEAAAVDGPTDAATEPTPRSTRRRRGFDDGCPGADDEGGPVEASAPPKPPRPKRTSS